MLWSSKDTRFAAVAGLSIFVKSHEVMVRPPETVVVGFIDASFSVIFISESAAYSCANFCSIAVLDTSVHLRLKILL